MTSAVTHHKYHRLYTLSQHLPSPQQYCSRVHSPDLHMDADAVPTSSSSNITSDSRKAAAEVATVTAACCTGGGEAVIIPTAAKRRRRQTQQRRLNAARRSVGRQAECRTARRAHAADGDARYLVTALIPVSCATLARLPEIDTGLKRGRRGTTVSNASRPYYYRNTREILLIYQHFFII